MTLRKSNGLAFQGDIALLNISALPDGVQEVTQSLNSAEREAYGYHPEKGLVLAQGESRAHYHAFRDTDNVKMFRLPANDSKKERLFLVVNRSAPLVHEEHDPIEIPAGTHELFFQYEYTFQEEYQRVAD
jgi:hypothetical protein